MNQLTNKISQFIALVPCQMRLVIFLLFCTSVSFSQVKDIRLDNGELLSTNEGLNGSIINCLYEGSDGFIWVGTSLGVNVYDGHRFLSYSSSAVSYILEDKHKCIWLAPRSYYGEHFVSEIEIINTVTNERKKIEDLEQEDSFLNQKILDFKQDDEFNLWFSTESGEIYKYDGIKIQMVYKNDSGKEIDHVLPITENEMIIDEDGHLIRWTKEEGIVSKQEMPFKIHEIWLGENGRIWMKKHLQVRVLNDGSNDKATYRSTELYYKDKGTAIQRFRLEDAADNINTKNFVLGQMSDGNIWYFWKDQIHCYDAEGKLLTRFSSPKDEQKKIALNFSESAHYGNKSILGKDGTLWLGTLSGVYKFSRKSYSFQQLIHQPSGMTLSTRGMAHIDDENLLVCTYDLGILKVDLKNKTTESVTLNENEVMGAGMTKDSNGDIWIGSHSNGIFRYASSGGNSGKYILEQFKLEIRTQLQLPYYDFINSRLWIGAAKEGLFYFDYQEEKIIPFQKWNNFEHLKNARILCFFQNDEKLWIGTDNGVYIISPEQGVIDWYNDFPIKKVKGIHHADDGNIWLVGESGLLRWDPSSNEQRLFSVKDGLSDDYIYTIYKDDFGFLWLPCNKGLMRFNLKSFEVNTFLPSAGITHEEFNLFSHYKDKKGYFYFGGLNGITVFDPGDFLETRTESSKIKLTDLKFAKNDSGDPINRLPEFKQFNKIEWEPSMKSMQVNFALQDYSLSNKQTYAYMVEGIDDDWVYVRENYLRFNKLPYGNYNLRIKGIGGKGLWSMPLNIPLEVIRPFYKTWWFLILVGLAFLGIIFFLFKWRLRSLEKEVAKRTQQIENDRQLIQIQYEELESLNKAKDRLYTIIAHDLRDPVTAFKGIAAKINYLINRNEPKRVFELAEYVEESADNLSKLLENLLSWAEQQRGELLFRPSKHKFESLVKEVVDLLDLFASSKGVKLKYSGCEEAEIYGDFHMLTTILRNLVHNAIKFSKPNGEVIVSCEKDSRGGLRFAVSDFGVGIHDSDMDQLFEIKTIPTAIGTLGEKGTGLGLVLCHDLVRKHQGEISVESNKGGATVFNVFIPLECD